MSRKYLMVLAGAVVMFAKDWKDYKRASEANPDVKFDYSMWLANVVIGAGAMFGVAETMSVE